MLGCVHLLIIFLMSYMFILVAYSFFGLGGTILLIALAFLLSSFDE